MTCSLSNHGALTERVGENLSGKGREGNKEGKGSCVETDHHFVAYVPVGARPATTPSPTESHTGMMPLREGWAA